MKSLLLLFHRDEIFFALISSGRSMFKRGEISVALISLGRVIRNSEPILGTLKTMKGWDTKRLGGEEAG